MLHILVQRILLTLIKHPFTCIKGAAVYGWDGTGYDTYNIAAPGNNIAPGQGFFIAVRGSAGTSQTITFTTAMQNTTG